MRLAWSRGLELLAAVVIASLWSCNAEDGGGAPPEQASGGSAGRSDWASQLGAPCFDCVAASCSWQLESCSFDPGCSAYASCAFECPLEDDGQRDAVCLAGCRRAPSSETVREVERLFSCIEQAHCPACARVSGDGGAPSEPTRPTLSCEPPFEDATLCDLCVWDRCCEESVACAAVATCGSFRDCFADCFASGTYAECRAACASSDAGEREYFRKLSCASLRCSEACGGRAAPCEECMSEQCLAPFRHCIADERCLELWTCVSMECTDGDASACQQRCSALHPEALDTFGMIFDCAATWCAASCG